MKKQVKINLGCGTHPVQGFINVGSCTLRQLSVHAQKQRQLKLDAEYIKANLYDLPFSDNFADYIESAGLGSVSFVRVLAAVREAYRVLKPGGEFFAVVVNFDDLARFWYTQLRKKTFTTPAMLRTYSTASEMIYGKQTSPCEFVATPFNPPFLARLFQDAGFKPEDIDLHLHTPGTAALRGTVMLQEIHVNVELISVTAIKR